MLIGLSGKMGVGKNYIGENVIPYILEKLINNIRIFPISFADHMKVELAIRDSKYNYDNLFINKTANTRKKLQEYGTDICRKEYGSDIWIKSIDMWMKIYQDRIPKSDTAIFIISDVRFKNEAKWIEENKGLLIRVIAPNRNKKRIDKEKIDKIDHISEIDLDDYKFKYIIDNESNDTLYNQIEIILKMYLSNR